MPISTDIIDNPTSDRIRHLATLVGKSGRRHREHFLIEGPQSVREAIIWCPEVISDLYIQAAGADDHRPASAVLQTIVNVAMERGGSKGRTNQEGDIYIHMASERVMDRISRDAQGVAALGETTTLHKAQRHMASADAGTNSTVAAFWQIRDPGNAGAVIRDADAAGCAMVVFVGDCVDPLNPKVIRATAGSLFHIPLLAMSEKEFFQWSRDRGMTTLAADVYGTKRHQPKSLTQLLGQDPRPSGPMVILFGNEARGLPAEILDRMESIVSIPLYGKAESLNLAASAAVLLFSLAMSSHIGRM